jgi:TetR/AcrR family transcriptional regulator
VPARATQERSLRTRAAILDAALIEFAANGFDGAGTRAIAQRAGVPQPSINYHYASKEALWRAAVDHLFGELRESLDGGRVEGSTGRAHLAETVRRFVRFAARRPELNRIMVQEATSDSPRLAWIVEHHVRPGFGMLSSQWEGLRRAGQVPDVDPLIAYYTFVGAASLLYVNAPEARRLTGRDPGDPAVIEAHADALVALLLGPEPDQEV